MRALLDLLDDDTTLITVNRRLARTLMEVHGARMLAEGRRAWRTPDVIPFSAWVERGFRAWAESSGDTAPALLRPAQERMLWEQVVRENAPAGDSGGPPPENAAAARQAGAAYRLLNAWDISLAAPEFGFSAESRAFRAWARAFETRCDAAGWLDPGRAASALAEPGRLVRVNPRRRAVFAGFDVVTPQQRALREALERCGVEVVDAVPAPRRSRITRREFADATAEIRAAAVWARRALAESPGGLIGVVVPELHRLRPMVERVFDEVMRPGAAAPGAAAGERPFNLSYGEPLSRVSVVGDALIALGLGRARIELAALGRLLRSPYIAGGQAALSARARLDAKLRDTGELELSLATLCARAPREDDLRARLDALLPRRRQAPRRQALKAWSSFFSEWLAGLGWPGERSPDSREYQAVEAFRDLLDELASMGAVSGPVDLERALLLLGQLADEHLFQPRAGPVPVQILGALETAGLAFDRLWVSGLHDGSWPPPPEPDAFIPVSLQRAAGMPAASPEGQLLLAGRRLEGWLEAADRVVLSHPLFDQDEPLRPSPALSAAAFAPAETEDPGATPAYTEQLNFESVALESVADERAPVLAATRLAGGGAGAIRDQAACPFRAFARWRLHVAAVPVAASPLDARIRGNLVHAVLKDLWGVIGTHARLCALSPDELEQQVAVAVDRALEKERRVRPETLRGTFARVERARLCALVQGWLWLEKQRAPFEVAARERDIVAAVGPLTLGIRPDRIDRLESGGHLVIDYKTGRPEVRDWFGERPDDPQLALYTLAFEADASGGEVEGAAYATIRRADPGFKGLAGRDGIAAGIEPLDATGVQAAREVADWPALKRGWRDTLESLAAAFAGGDARVDPKSRHASCAHCEVMPLCRVFEHDRDEESEQ